MNPQEEQPEIDQAEEQDNEAAGNEEAMPETEASPKNLEAELKDQLLRLHADFDNYRKRHAKERLDAIKLANEGLIMDLLPILDSFELGIKAAQNAQNVQDLLQGMNMVYGQLQRVLSEAGVQEIDAMDQKFDPHMHEAVAHEVHNEVEEGTVIGQHRKGYKLHHRLLRPASVIVSHASQDAAQAAEHQN